MLQFINNKFTHFLMKLSGSFLMEIGIEQSIPDKCGALVAGFVVNYCAAFSICFHLDPLRACCLARIQVAQSDQFLLIIYFIHFMGDRNLDAFDDV